MKQTNNAIKFLMAQYRAIFKNAYFKGMATALVLTAGLAAGQAQAASAEDPFYTFDSSQSFTLKTQYTEAVNNSTQVAGDYDDGTTADHDDGVVSGESLVFGPSGATAPNGHPADIGSLNSGSAYGGYVKIESGALDATASDNKAYVLSGGTINTDGNLVGGWAKTNGTGIAQALNNELHINAGATITKANNFIGGVAAGLHGAEASNNKVTITGNTTGAKLNLTQSGTYAGVVFVGDATHSGATGTFTAQGNELKVENSTASGDTVAQKTFMGGRVWALGVAANNSIDSLSALGNSVTIKNSEIGTSGGTNVANIVANWVGYTGVTGAHVALLEANGTANSGLTIENTTIYNADTYGGYAVNQSGGSATANANIVEIKDTDFLATDAGSGNGLRAGYAESTMTAANQAINLEASSNTITIDNTSTAQNRAAKQFVGDITGGRAQLNSGSGINEFTGAVLTANNNTVTVEDGVTVQGNIYGAYVAARSTSGGATVNASNNTVTLNGDLTGGTGHVIAGAIAEPGVTTMDNNHVVINGKVTDTAFIYGASASEQQTIAGKITSPQHTLTNNSITFGKDADRYIAAAGHYGNKSASLVKHYVEDLGFEYLSASDKVGFEKCIDHFFASEISQKPILLEVFTDSVDESNAEKMIRSSVYTEKDLVLSKLKSGIKSIVGENNVQKIKNLMK